MELLLRVVYPVKGPDDPAYKGQLPVRMRFLAPDAVESLIKLEQASGGLVYSDMYRSAESSLLARRTKRGVQAPAYSAHNYGFAVDLDLDAIMKKGTLKSYYDILITMKQHGWYCHRRDGQGPDKPEAWHFNHFGDDFDKYLSVTTFEPVTWAKAVEKKIWERYGSNFSLTPAMAQTALKTLSFYNGAVDGQFGPLSREATMAFQRAWGLPEDGQLSAQTQRTLAFVTATKRIV